MRTVAFVLVLLLTIALAIMAGCGGTDLIPTYVGGGLPPGEPDIGGIVLQEVATQSDAAAQATAPVAGAYVVLFRGQQQVGRATTGATGHFRFERPATGQYRVRVTPPDGSGLQQATRQFRHQAGRQTFLTIVLLQQ